MRELRLARLAHVVVEAFDRHGPVGLPQRGERLDEPPGRVLIERRAAGVRVVGQRADRELDVEDPAHAADERRPVLGVEAATLLERSVACGQVGPLLQHRVEVPARRLLLALDEEADLDRQRPDGFLVRLGGLDPDEELSFVIRDAAGEELVVADRRLVGRRGPEVERRRGLHVVVLDADEGALASSDLTDDEWRDAVLLDELDLRAGLAEPVRGPLRAAPKRGQLRGLAGDPAKFTELVGPPLRPLRDELVELLVGQGRPPGGLSQPSPRDPRARAACARARSGTAGTRSRPPGSR